MTKKVYVGNLSFDATEQQVRDMFSEFGKVESVAMINDRDTKRFKGFCFVEMEDSAAKAAISALDGKSVDGRDLRVNEARPREESSGGNRGGGGYRGGGSGSGGGNRSSGSGGGNRSGGSSGGSGGGNRSGGSSGNRSGGSSGNRSGGSSGNRSGGGNRDNYGGGNDW